MEIRINNLSIQCLLMSKLVVLLYADTVKQYHRTPIDSRTASFNFVLYKILRAYHNSNSGLSLLIYPLILIFLLGFRIKHLIVSGKARFSKSIFKSYRCNGHQRSTWINCAKRCSDSPWDYFVILDLCCIS